ncbi:MAG: hypothetical protein NWE99_08660 [Candidatus Bathyarchaeota archaeon]|nr:hypothetical protein [Candidatus Bathyarchaeota archaeon]
MQRREAVLILREICDCPDSKLISCVFLKPQTGNAGFLPDSYELHIKGSFTETTIKRIKAIVEKHKLHVKECNGYLIIIREPKRRILEVIA